MLTSKSKGERIVRRLPEKLPPEAWLPPKGPPGVQPILPPTLPVEPKPPEYARAPTLSHLSPEAQRLLSELEEIARAEGWR